MKVFMNRRPIVGPYGGGNLWISSMHLFAQENGIELQTLETFDDPDVILVGGLDASDGQPGLLDCIVYKEKLKNEVKIVLRLNENDARKGTSHVDELVKRVSPELDSIVYVSEWLKDYFEQGGVKVKNSVVIKNGVDRETFARQPKIPNGKVNIVTHHWSDNYLKGFDVYDELDRFVGSPEGERFTFTYIGRERGTFKNSNVIKPLHGISLGKELGRYDVYVSASRNDPGPNHCTESISCQLPTYVHEDGGGSVEFAGKDHVYRDWNDLKKILLGGDFQPNTTKFGSWAECVERFCNHIHSL